MIKPTAQIIADSTSNRKPTGVRDLHALDLERRTVRDERLGHHRCEPVEHKHSQHFARETMSQLKHILDGTMLAEQLKRLAPFWDEVRF
jgi:hypothetical protein